MKTQNPKARKQSATFNQKPRKNSKVEQSGRSPKKQPTSSNLKSKRILIPNYEFPPLGGGASPVSYELAKGYVKVPHEMNEVNGRGVL